MTNSEYQQKTYAAKLLLLTSLKADNERLVALVKALSAAGEEALFCIEVQNTHSWDESNTIEESIARGNWCKLAIDARRSLKDAIDAARKELGG